MNAKPHTHEIEIKSYRGLNGGDCWYVTYGDQSEQVHKFNYTPRRRWFWQQPRPVEEPRVRLERAIKRVVARHDSRSREAGREQDMLTSVTPVLKGNRWGSEQLK